MKDPYIGMPITMGRQCHAESNPPGSSHPRPPQNMQPPQDMIPVQPPQDSMHPRPPQGGSIQSPQPSPSSTDFSGFDVMYLSSLPLAMTYTPMQQWQKTYSDSVALSRGTLFPELDLPFDGRTILTERLKGGSRT